MIHSLRLRLLLIAVISVMIGWTVAATFTYFHASRQVHRLFDAQLSMVGQMLATRMVHELNERDLAVLRSGLFAGAHEGVFAFQLWGRDGRLLQHTANAPRDALGDGRGSHADRTVAGNLWRVFVISAGEGDFEVHVGVPHESLDAASRYMFLDDMLPVTLALPVAILLLALGIQYGVAPLLRVAQELRARSHRRLDAICSQGVPSEARPLIEALNGLLARLERAFSREARFTADCAHELRGPLAGIKTQAQVAQRARDETTRAEALDQVLTAVDRATHLVEQLLSLARCDPEAPPLPHSRIDLNAVVRPVLEDLGPAALAKGVNLELLSAERAFVQGNAEALAILTRNLVDNAIRYSPMGSAVRVRTEARDDRLCLVVEDEGPGIPEDERERVLDRFYRVQGTAPQGSGLGLSIVKSIAQTHDTVVRLLSPPSGRGLQAEVCFAAEGQPACRQDAGLVT